MLGTKRKLKTPTTFICRAFRASQALLIVPFSSCESRLLVPGTGIEPVSHAAADFKSAVYTNSTTRASREFSHRRAELPSLGFNPRLNAGNYFAFVLAVGARC